MKKYRKEYENRPEVKEYKKEKLIIYKILSHYKKELKETNLHIRRTKKNFTNTPFFLKGKQVQLQNIVDNINIIISHTEKMPRNLKVKTRNLMLNKLLAKEGESKIDSFDIPLENKK